MAREGEGWKNKPLFSIIMLVCNTNEIYLRKAINSIIDQIYDNWELCIIDNASSRQIISLILEEYCKKTPRIKVISLAKRVNTVKAFNEALRAVSGEYVLSVGHTDEIAPHALWTNAKRINTSSDLDFIYSDHDEIDAIRGHYSPKFKANWNTEILDHKNTGQLMVFKKKALGKADLFQEKYSMQQNYDILLQHISQSVAGIAHIADILYHYRPDSTTATRS